MDRAVVRALAAIGLGLAFVPAWSAGVSAMGEKYESREVESRERDADRRAETRNVADAEIDRATQAEKQQDAEAKQRLTAAKSKLEQDKRDIEAKYRQRRDEAETQARRERDELNAEKQTELTKVETDEQKRALETQFETRRRGIEAKLQQTKETLESELRQKKADIEAKLKEEKADANARFDGADARADERAARRDVDTSVPADGQPAAVTAGAGANAAQDDMQLVSGTITVINPDAGLLVLEEQQPGTPRVSTASSAPVTSPGAESSARLVLDKNTTVLSGGRRMALEDLQVGDRIQVRVHTQSGQRMAHTILLTPSGLPR